MDNFQKKYDDFIKRFPREELEKIEKTAERNAFGVQGIILTPRLIKALRAAETHSYSGENQKD